MQPPTTQKIPPRIWHYYIDDEGLFWHDGLEVDDESFLKFFMENMQWVDGHYEALCQGERCQFTAQDTPFIIQNLQMAPTHINLVFAGHHIERLDPKTLFVGKDNILYCQIPAKNFVARFNRKSYFEIAHHITWDPQTGQYFLELNSEKYLIAGVKSH